MTGDAHQAAARLLLDGLHVPADLQAQTAAVDALQQGGLAGLAGHVAERFTQSILQAWDAEVAPVRGWLASVGRQDLADEIATSLGRAVKLLGSDLTGETSPPDETGVGV